MCGRYTLIKLADLTDLFPWVAPPPSQAVSRYNIAPSQPILAVTNDQPDRYTHLLWGLVPAWAKDPTIGNRMINARAESIAAKPAFKNAFKRRRCLIPADGFYEWRAQPGGRGKQPMYITRVDGRLFAFAGIWEHWIDNKGNELRTAAVITTDANEMMAPIHDRMPVILQPESFPQWLSDGDADPDDLLPLLRPYPADQLVARPVSHLVNSPHNDTPECIAPAAAPPPPKPPDKGLFD